MTLHVDPATIAGGLPANIARRLRVELGEDVFTSWFGRLELDGIGEGVAQLSVPTKFLKTWIQHHFSERLLTILSAEIPEVSTVTIAIRSSARIAFRQVAAIPAVLPTPTVIQQPAAHPVRIRAEPVEPPAEALPASPLDRRLTFATFQAGPSNQLALTAAKLAAEHVPGQPPRWSPLFVHGAVGLGKTHLLQAIAHDAGARGRKVVYLSAERFMYGFVLALKAQTMLAFQERLRGVDILLIDDVQFLQGKSIQQEFCNTINTVVAAGKQLVLAADRPPHELEHLDERVRSRLAGGLCVEIRGMDRDVRVRILESLTAAAPSGLAMSAGVIAYVADAVQSNGRDLAGAANRLLAHAGLAQAPLSIDAAAVAIADLVRTREPKRVRIEDIQKLVATHYNVSRGDILSARRTANVVRPRQIAMYLSKILTLRSLPEIGRRFGGRDHTTVLHAVRKMEKLTAEDASLGDEVAGLRRMLED